MIIKQYLKRYFVRFLTAAHVGNTTTIVLLIYR